MKNPGEQILEDSVADVAREGGENTVNGYTKNVKEKVKQRTDALQEQLGGAAKDIVGDAMAKAEGYVETKKRILDPNFKVKDTASKGAAAWNDKGNGNEIAVDNSAMDVKADENYWKRTSEHEKVHRDLQAGAYNRKELSYVNKAGQVKTADVGSTVVEWQATQVNEDGDLTAEYKKHKAEGQELADAVGEEKVVAALKTGDMQALQDEIIEEAVKQRPLTEEETTPPPVTEIADEYEGEELDVDKDDEGKIVIVPKGGPEAAYEREGKPELAMAA